MTYRKKYELLRALLEKRRVTLINRASGHYSKSLLCKEKSEYSGYGYHARRSQELMDAQKIIESIMDEVENPKPRHCSATDERIAP